MKYLLSSKQTILATALVFFMLGYGWRSQAHTMWRQAEQSRLSGAYYEALQQYAELPQITPQVELAQTSILLIRGDWAQAQAQLEQVLTLELTPQERDQAWLWYGWSQLQQGRMAQAEAAWGHVAAQNSALNVVQLEQVLAQGLIAEAMQQLNSIEAVSPEWQAWYQIRAAQLALLDQPMLTQQILTDFHAPEQIFPLSPLAHQDYTQARDELLKATTLSRPARIIMLAQQWSVQNLPQASEMILQLISETDAYWPRAQHMLANLLMSRNEYMAAQEVLNQIQAQYDNIPEIWHTQVLLSLATGDTESAAQALNRAETLAGRQAEHYYLAALLAQANQDFDQANNALDMSIAVAASEQLSGTYALKAANTYVALPLQLCTTARAYAQQAIGSEVDIQARLLEAQLALRCGETQTAQQVLAPLLETMATDPAVLYLRGAILLQLGQPEEGRAFLLQVTNQAPRSIWRYQAEQLLAS